MKRLLALLLAPLLAAWPAVGQTRQPAQITTQPAVTPQSLYWLDKDGAWQNLPTGGAGGRNIFNFTTSTVTPGGPWTQAPFIIGTTANLDSVAPNGAFLNMAPVPPNYPATGDLRLGMHIITEPGNIPDPQVGFHNWNYIQSKIDTYWPVGVTPSMNTGTFIETFMNPGNSANVNGSVQALHVRSTLSNPAQQAPSVAGLIRNYIGAQIDSYAPLGDGGVATTLTAAAIATATTLQVASTTGMSDHDSIQVVLDGGKFQSVGDITVVDATHVSFPSLNQLKAGAASGNQVVDAKGVVYAQSGVAQMGDSTAQTFWMSQVVQDEKDVQARSGNLWYKMGLVIASLAGDNVNGAVVDAAIDIYAGTNTGGAASAGFTDAILIGGPGTSKWPIKPYGGLMMIDGHGFNTQTIGYGIDLSWATIIAGRANPVTGRSSTGYAFAFSSTGNGTPDNFWNNVQLNLGNGVFRTTGTGNILGGLSLSALPTSGDGTGLNLCAQSNGLIYRKATCP